MSQTLTPMSGQGQASNSTATQVEFLGFQVRTNKKKSTHNGTVCAPIARNDTERYKKHTDQGLAALHCQCVASKLLPGTHCVSL